MKTILDISKWQSDIDFSKITGVDGFIYRACISFAYVDPCFDKFCANKEPIGIYVASYAKDISEAKKEADYICSLATTKNIAPAIFFDWEYFSANYILTNFSITATPELVQNMTDAFCSRCIEHGFKTGVYFNKDFLDRFYTRAFFEKHPEYLKWYARPGYATPDYECDIWQYASNNGSEFGYPRDIDKNIQFTEFDDKVFVEPMKPISPNPIKMVIGPASSGDIHTLTTQIEGLGIQCEVIDGFIYTSEMSQGDQCSIMLTCNTLSLPYKQFVSVTCPNNIEKEDSENIFKKILRWIFEFFGLE